MNKIITTLCIAGASLFSTATAAELTNYTLDPAAGSTVESLSEIKISFPDRDSASGYFFTFDETKGYITNGTDTIPTGQISVRLTENYKIITFVKKDTGADITISTPGEWSLYLAPGAFFLWDYDNDDDDAHIEDSPAISVTYTIGEVGGGDDTTPSPTNLSGWITDPENGAVISSFNRLNVCFPNYDTPDNGGFLKANADKISVTDGTNTYEVFYGNNTAGYTNWQSKGFYAINEDGEEIKLENGTYTWTFEEGAFQSLEWGDDDDIVLAESAAFSITITIGEAPVEKSPYNLSKWISVPQNDAVLDELGRITVSFPDFEPADWGFLKVNKSKVSLSDGKKDYDFFYGMPATGYNAQNSKGFFAQNEDGEEITLTAPSTYTWAFEAGAFQSLDEDDNVLAESEAFAITYTVAGANPLEYTVDPASGSTVDFPAGNLTVTYTFANATSVSPEAFEVDSNVGGGADSRGIRVTYGTEPLPRLDALTGDARGYTLTADGNKLVYTFSHNIFAANGVLKISADEGTYGVDGQHGPALEYTLTVGQAKDYTYTITPESGAEGTEFATFTITFPGATTATFTEGSYVVLNGPRMLTQYSCTQVEGAEHPTFELTFDPAPYMWGTYSLSVEEGAFTLDGKFASPAIRGSYTLLRTTDVDTTILPSPLGSKVVATEYGTYVGFVFAEDESVTYDRATYESNIEVKFDGTTLKMGSDYIFKLSSDDAGQYKIEIYMEGSSPYVGKTGTLSVSFAEGTFTISGEPSPAINKTWQVIAPRTYDWTSNPADGSTTASLAEITITFLEAEEAEVYLNSFVNLRDTEYLYYGTLTESYSKTTEEGAAVTLVFNPAPTEDGEYVLSCDYSAFVIDDGIETPNMDLHFFLDKNAGLGKIELTNGLYTVYSIDGRLVLDKAEYAALKTLEPGFYIINGKKTAIK
ncbi:MAG: hypothetical protein HDS65_00820 [Bacteroidales bacterium]|nr:hypothetical protein [Bacteroidales bacterium]